MYVDPDFNLSRISLIFIFLLINSYEERMLYVSFMTVTITVVIIYVIYIQDIVSYKTIVFSEYYK